MKHFTHKSIKIIAKEFKIVTLSPGMFLFYPVGRISPEVVSLPLQGKITRVDSGRSQTGLSTTMSHKFQQIRHEIRKSVLLFVNLSLMRKLCFKAASSD